MPDFLYTMPSLLLFFTLFLIGSIVSTVSFLLVSWFIPLSLRENQNVPSGYIAASIGVIYAVLAGFVILYAMNNFDKASKITMHEATTISKIFRAASRLPEPLQTEIQQAMRNYVNLVIHVEIPALAENKFTKSGLPILNKLDHQMNSYKTSNMIIFLRLHAIHDAISDLYTTYDQRMDINNSALTPDLWALFIISSILILIINCLLGLTIRLQIVLQFILTLMVSSVLYLIIAMDHPFSGSYAISSDVFKTSLSEMNNYQKR